MVKKCEKKKSTAPIKQSYVFARERARNAVSMLIAWCLRNSMPGKSDDLLGSLIGEILFRASDSN